MKLVSKRNDQGSPERSLRLTQQALRRIIRETVKRRLIDEYPPEMEREDEPYNGEPCPACGGTNTRHEEPIPGMMGGEEIALTCDDCGETFPEDPLYGGYGHGGKKVRRMESRSQRSRVLEATTDQATTDEATAIEEIDGELDEAGIKKREESYSVVSDVADALFDVLWDNITLGKRNLSELTLLALSNGRSPPVLVRYEDIDDTATDVVSEVMKKLKNADLPDLLEHYTRRLLRNLMESEGT